MRGLIVSRLANKDRSSQSTLHDPLYPFPLYNLSSLATEDMANPTLRGAYIILFQDSSKALNCNGCLAELDEEPNRDSQIWWIEADPGFGDLSCNKNKAEDGGIYRICNLAMEKSLQCSETEPGKKVTVMANNGAPRQLWRIRVLPHNENG